MLPVLGDIRGTVDKFKLFNTGKVVVDSVVAKLHYRFTFGLLIASCILVSSGQFFGKPIQCMQDSFAVRQEALDQYCYVAATFSMPRLFQQYKLGNQVAHLGVGTIDGEEPTYHNYYQWVPFVLLLQAMMFYLPHYAWKNLEGKKVKKLLDGTNVMDLSGVNEETKGKIKVLATYLHNSQNSHTGWGLKFVICEILYLVNIIGQIFFTNAFLGGAFLDFGNKVINSVNEDPEVRVDPMASIFPRMTKCTFQRYGPSGTIQVHDSLCLLAINIINEKIYIFLWFWFIILASITSFAFIYRLATFCFSSIRARSLIWLAGANARGQIQSIVRAGSFSDWLLLDMLRENIPDQKVYIELLNDLSELQGYKVTGKYGGSGGGDSAKIPLTTSET